MLPDNPTARVIRAVRLLRDQGGTLTGGEYDRLIRSNMQRRTSNLNWPTDLLRTLVRARLVQVHLMDDEEPLTPAQFERSLLEYSLNHYMISLIPYFDDLCHALGITSLSEYEQRTDPRAVSVTPVFGTARQTGLLRRDITVLMPFGVTASSVYTEVIRPVCEALDLTVARIEDLYARQEVMSQIWSAIYTCELLIADCTGRDAAVFYGLGVAHTIGKRTILLAQELEDIPYNILQHAHMAYHPSQTGYVRLRQELQQLIPQTWRE